MTGFHGPWPFWKKSLSNVYLSLMLYSLRSIFGRALAPRLFPVSPPLPQKLNKLFTVILLLRWVYYPNCAANHTAEQSRKRHTAASIGIKGLWSCSLSKRRILQAVNMPFQTYHLNYSLLTSNKFCWKVKTCARIMKNAVLTNYSCVLTPNLSDMLIMTYFLRVLSSPVIAPFFHFNWILLSPGSICFEFAVLIFLIPNFLLTAFTAEPSVIIIRHKNDATTSACRRLRLYLFRVVQPPSLTLTFTAAKVMALSTWSESNSANTANNWQ